MSTVVVRSGDGRGGETTAFWPPIASASNPMTSAAVPCKGLHPEGHAPHRWRKTSRGTAYLTASLPAPDAQLADLPDSAHRRLS